MDELRGEELARLIFDAPESDSSLVPSSWRVVDAPDGDAWLRARDGFLTASDVSAVLGCNPYKSRNAVLEAKRAARAGTAKPTRVVGAMMAGQFLEEGVLRWWLHDRTAEAVALGEAAPAGGVLRNPLGTSILVRHAELALAASPDGIVYFGDGTRQLVEVKLLGPEGSYLRWADACKSRAWSTPIAKGGLGRDPGLGCPVPHYIQLQCQLLCTGETFGWVVGCCGTKRMDHPFDRDEPLMRRIEDATVEFWAEVERG